jgi:site-specific DNA-methyltransferase (cytosine-N4-specific)
MTSAARIRDHKTKITKRATVKRESKIYDVTIEESPPSPTAELKPIYKTSHGAAYFGDSSDLLRSEHFKKKYYGKVQLAFTSPPFPLNTKKKYGNLKGEQYINWFAQFAPLLRDLVTSDGSIVIEIGNAWEPGRPVMSTLVLRALLKFLEEGGLNLCQEFIWYNPARLPSPVQWVNVERIRVKDAFTRIWWMSPSDRPKADNRQILREYSESMKKLIRTGKYNAGSRPSQHNIGKKSFATDNRGAIPPNVIAGDEAPSLGTLLKGTNTRSHDQYQLFCRSRNIPLHPARMPLELVYFFRRFLTTKNDLVLDPFAGSNTTGAVAERLGRRWLSCEANWSYAASSITRFDPNDISTTCNEIRLQKTRHAASSASSVFIPVFTS